MPASALLDIEDLCVDIPRGGDGYVRVVDSVSLSLGRRDSLGLVGESGSGKTLTAMSVLRMITIPGVRVTGAVHLDGRDLLSMPEAELRGIRGDEVAVVYQDALSSLNPVRSVGHQIVEALRAHRQVDRRSARAAAIELLDRVRIPDPAARVDQYPHEFSGGMRQRVMIAMALACQPRILIADEPTTALDVTVQSRILDTFNELRSTSDMSLLFISHDLRAVAKVCDRIAVMYAGRVVESGSTADVLSRPAHPYTKALLASLPRVDRRSDLLSIEGSPPDPGALPQGCSFHPRCPLARDLCRRSEPAFERVADDHASRCHFAGEVESRDAFV